MEELAKKFAGYLQHKMPHVSNVEVRDLSRIHGGASRETYRLTGHWDEEGTAVAKPLILRRDPEVSLIETERDLEFNAYLAFHGTGVPVPEALFLELETKWLDRPFFVMEQIIESEAASPFLPDPYGALADKLAPQFFGILGKISAQQPDAIGLASSMEQPALEACAVGQLDYWVGEINKDALEPNPLLQSAIRWLRRNPPPPPKRLSVVHGDYRTGNFLYNTSGDITAILDWEMCHLGDPLEDLAWAIDPLWAFENGDRPASLMEREAALALWEEASGFDIDRAALLWWEVFSAVKGLAIWISAGKEFQTGGNADPIMGLSSWYCTDVHTRLLAARMPKLRAEERS
ncbi:MAG: phosphotransferase family protein [Parvibaculaceae bacterium]|nr:phosphotransferase family protein [Parvibaculaceae bacterium]